ncbi:MarR family transcriptional regulator [Herbiconiux moechotypicola]|uniref:MarR family transcriptional regulator TamR n=1 Tax=Herbiconiux moechotypicola TaxID=637393 RepID=A0ABP5QUQ3_9MICO|nr:MarR family transcriptional regulator [Herbiconiux moechotypicola]MCS5730950.1 MarR family transcriptional regulator [Herbiconiux moechotypicola]
MAPRDARDTVDEIVDAWMREHPGLDFSPLKILSRVTRLAKQLEKTRRASFATAELEPWEFDVLAALRRAGTPHELSPKALLEQTYVSSGTMTNRIDGMVRRGLVERRTDPNDGRGVLVSMTAEGRIRVDQAISHLVTAETELLAGLSRADQDRLATLLRRLSLDMA